MTPRLVGLAVVATWGVSLVTGVTSEPTLLRPNESNRRVSVGAESVDSARWRALKAGDGADGSSAEENIVLREGILFQTTGCPQVISAEEASARAKNDSIPGNIINLSSEGEGRAGNHFVVLSAYLAMAYCCKAKVLEMPRFDDTFPSAKSEDGGHFEAHNRFFDFSRVDTMPLEEFEGLSSDPLVCKPYFELSGVDAWHLWKIHADLLSCMNRVYVRGCEAAYLEPLLGTEKFGYCANPAATNRRQLSDNNEQRDVATTATTTPLLATVEATSGPPVPASLRTTQSDPAREGCDRIHRVEDATAGEGSSSERSRNGVPSRDDQASRPYEDAIDGRRRLHAAGKKDGKSSAEGEPKLTMASLPVDDDDGNFDTSIMTGLGERGSAGSLVIHIRSGDIFKPVKPGKVPSRCFQSYGQPPLQFYLRAIASQPWSDVTILTFCPKPEQLNPTFAALEMMQQMGTLGPKVATHKDRDLLTDIRSMLCADGLAVARSTLHFFTFAHTRAKHIFVPSECGLGTYARGRRPGRETRKKPNPNNTTLLCIENPETEVYGVDWEVDEAAYSLYDNWNASSKQRLDMVIFNGVKGLSRCCVG